MASSNDGKTLQSDLCNAFNAASARFVAEGSQNSQDSSGLHNRLENFSFHCADGTIRKGLTSQTRRLLSSYVEKVDTERKELNAQEETMTALIDEVGRAQHSTMAVLKEINEEKKQLVAFHHNKPQDVVQAALNHLKQFIKDHPNFIPEIQDAAIDLGAASRSSVEAALEAVNASKKNADAAESNLRLAQGLLSSTIESLEPARSRLSELERHKAHLVVQCGNLTKENEMLQLRPTFDQQDRDHILALKGQLEQTQVDLAQAQKNENELMENMASLTLKLESVEDNGQELQKKLADADLKILHNVSEKDELSEHYTALKLLVQKYKKKAEKSKQRRLWTKRKVHLLNSRLSLLDEENIAQGRSIVVLTSELAALKSQMAEQEIGQFARLHEQEQRFAQCQRECENLHQTNVNLLNAADRNEQSTKRLQTEAQASLKTIHDLEISNAQLRTLVAETTAQSENLSTSLESINHALSAKTAEIAGLKDFIAIRTQECAQAWDQYHQLELHTGVIEEDRDLLQDDFDGRTVVVAAKTMEIRNLEQHNECLQARIDEMSASSVRYRITMDALYRELRDLKVPGNRMSVAPTTIAQSLDECLSASQRLSRFVDGSRIQLERWRTYASVLQNENDRKTAEIDQLNSECLVERRATERCQEVNKGLLDAVTVADFDMSTMEDRLCEQENRNEALKRGIWSISSRNELMGRDLRAREVEITKGQQQMSHLVDRLSECQTRLDESVHENDRLRTEVGILGEIRKEAEHDRMLKSALYTMWLSHWPVQMKGCFDNLLSTSMALQLVQDRGLPPTVICGLIGTDVDSIAHTSAISIMMEMLCGGRNPNMRDLLEVERELNNTGDDMSRRMIISIALEYLSRECNRGETTDDFAYSLIWVVIFKMLLSNIASAEHLEATIREWATFKSKGISSSLLTTAMVMQIDHVLNDPANKTGLDVILLELGKSRGAHVELNGFNFIVDEQNLLIVAGHDVAFVRPNQFYLEMDSNFKWYLATDSAPIVSSRCFPAWQDDDIVMAKFKAALSRSDLGNHPVLIPHSDLILEFVHR